MRNEDYNFSVTVPAGRTGWSGVAESAPFHGFTIFLDDKRQSCVVFEIHLRVEEEDAPKRPGRAKSLTLGKAKGWQSMSSGIAGGTRMLNVISDFSFTQADQVDDGSVRLIVPSGRAKGALKIYRKFLESLKFGNLKTTAR